MTDQRTPSISVIMPAFNEGELIFGSIRETRNVLLAAGHDAEIIVVDDGSADNTYTEIERAAALFGNVRAASNPYNMGKGMALRTGFDHSRGDTIIFIDADLDLHPSQINGLIDKLSEGNADIVVTSKHHPDSQLAYPMTRTIASLGYYAIIKFLFGLPVRDTQTGLKLFKRDVLEQVFHRLLVKTYAYDVELLATAIRFGYRITEIPVVLDYRRHLTWGRIRVSDVLRIFADTLAVFYRLRILKYYDMDRPRAVQGLGPVMVVTRGDVPSKSVMARLSLDTDTRIASLGRIEQGSDMQSFGDEDAFYEWLSGEGSDIAFVGILGPECTPQGSWVKNALRNFSDSTVTAVCGPVVPGPMISFGRKVAAMLYSSVLSAGPDHYLRSIARSRTVSRGSLDNIVVRADTIRNNDHKGCKSSEALLHVSRTGKGNLRYDPDVAVSRPVPPLIWPYIRSVILNAFDKGRGLFGRISNIERLWALVPSLGLLCILWGGFLLPVSVIHLALIGYAIAIIFTGIIYFEPLAFPVYAVGIVTEHVIRAIMTPMGILARIIMGPPRQ